MNEYFYKVKFSNYVDNVTDRIHGILVNKNALQALAALDKIIEKKIKTSAHLTVHTYEIETFIKV